MKGFLAALLVSVPLLANAWTITASDTPSLVNPTQSYAHNFNLADDGFVVGSDVVTSYKVKVLLTDTEHFSWFDVNLAALDQPGSLGDDLELFWSSGDLQGASLQGKFLLNSVGQLDIDVFSLTGSFYVSSAVLTAEGAKGGAHVPEPTSLALLAAGMIGIVIMRRIASRAS